MAGSTERLVKTLSLCYRTPGSRAGRRRGPPGSGPAEGSGPRVPPRSGCLSLKVSRGSGSREPGSECHSRGRRPGIRGSLLLSGKRSGAAASGSAGDRSAKQIFTVVRARRDQHPVGSVELFPCVRTARTPICKDNSGKQMPHLAPPLAACALHSSEHVQAAGEAGRAGGAHRGLPSGDALSLLPQCRGCPSASGSPEREGSPPRATQQPRPASVAYEGHPSPAHSPRGQPPSQHSGLLAPGSPVRGGRHPPHLDGWEGETLSETPRQAGPQTCAPWHGQPPRPHPSPRTAPSLQIWTLRPEASRKSGSPWPRRRLK